MKFLVLGSGTDSLSSRTDLVLSFVATTTCIMVEITSFHCTWHISERETKSAGGWKAWVPFRIPI